MVLKGELGQRWLEIQTTRGVYTMVRPLDVFLGETEMGGMECCLLFQKDSPSVCEENELERRKRQKEIS